MNSAVLDRLTKARAYKALVALFPPRIIENSREHEASLKVVERFMEVDSLSKDQQAYLELLSELVETYEKKHFAIAAPSLGDLLALLFVSRGASMASVGRVAGIGASLISDVLAGRRTLSLEAIRRLSAYFGIDASLFVEAGTGGHDAAA